MILPLLSSLCAVGLRLWWKLRAGFDRQAFRGLVSQAGVGLVVDGPFYVFNGRYVKIGARFRSRHGLRLEAWDRFGGESFTPRIEIGDDVSLGHNCHVGSINSVIIRDRVLIASNVLVIDHNHGITSDYENGGFSKTLPLSGARVLINEDVWIGQNVCVLAGVEIGAGSIVAAGSVVTKSVPPKSLVGGVPARVLRALSG